MSKLWTALSTMKRVVDSRAYSRFVRNLIPQDNAISKQRERPTTRQKQNPSNRLSAKQRIPRKNPGMDHTLRMMHEENLKISEDEIEDLAAYEDAEPDFMNVHLQHRQYEQETIDYKERMARNIVKKKYFDDPYPNLLTWSEKEHIRYLHSKDPEEWSVERLAQCFPATESTIKKIISVVWKPANEKRITRHDASAMRNWRELKDDTLDGLTPELRKRFLKFSDRVIPPRRPTDVEKTIRVSLGEDVSNEFSSIVADAKESKKSPKPHSKDDSSLVLQYLDPPKQPEKINTNERVTLEELQSSIRLKVDSNEAVSAVDKLIIEQNVPPVAGSIDRATSTSTTTAMEDVREKTMILSEPSVMETYKASMKALIYPEKIRIPKKVWKRGGTYKVNDCYYDDDGLFLYRVPGM